MRTCKPPLSVRYAAVEAHSAHASGALPDDQVQSYGMQRRRFIVVEGVPGVGKTTLAATLSSEMDGAPILRLTDEFRVARGQLETDPEVGPTHRLDLYLSATADLAERVRKALRATDVVCDRFYPSALGLFEAEGELDTEAIEAAAEPHLQTAPRPAVTVVLHATHPILRQRIEQRVRIPLDTAVHRRARDSAAFADRWARAIDRLAAKSGPVLTVDTTYMSAGEVARYVLTGLATPESPEVSDQ